MSGIDCPRFVFSRLYSYSLWSIVCGSWFVVAGCSRRVGNVPWFVVHKLVVLLFWQNFQQRPPLLNALYLSLKGKVSYSCLSFPPAPQPPESRWVRKVRGDCERERVIDRFGKISRPSSQEFALVTEEVKNSLKIRDTVTEHGDWCKTQILCWGKEQWKLITKSLSSGLIAGKYRVWSKLRFKNWLKLENCDKKLLKREFKFPKYY